MPEWITTAEAVVLSGYNIQYLRILIREGKIDAQKFGMIWQVNRQSLLDYLDIAQTTATADRRHGARKHIDS